MICHRMSLWTRHHMHALFMAKYQNLIYEQNAHSWRIHQWGFCTKLSHWNAILGHVLCDMIIFPVYLWYSFRGQAVRFAKQRLWCSILTILPTPEHAPAWSLTGLSFTNMDNYSTVTFSLTRRNSSEEISSLLWLWVLCFVNETRHPIVAPSIPNAPAV